MTPGPDRCAATGKVRHPSRRLALHALRGHWTACVRAGRTFDGDLMVFWCSACSAYHLGGGNRTRRHPEPYRREHRDYTREFDLTGDDEMKTATKAKPRHPIALGDRVVVRRCDPPGTSSGGVYLPDQSKTDTNHGVVVGVGPGTPDPDWPGRLVPVCAVYDPGASGHRAGVSRGDEVVFHLYSAVEVEVDGETFAIVGGDDVLAVIPKADAP